MIEIENVKLVMATLKCEKCGLNMKCISTKRSIPLRSVHVCTNAGCCHEVTLDKTYPFIGVKTEDGVVLPVNIKLL